MITSLYEADIRPDNLMQAQAERFAADIKRMLAHQDEFLEVACPACKGLSANKVFAKYGFIYVMCTECETMYINPRPSPTLLEMYYRTSENYAYWNKYIFPASEGARREKIFRPRAERLAEICLRYNVRHRVLLEVGSGFGTFCEELRRMNVFERIIAVEPTPDLAATCRGRGLEVIEKPIEQIDHQDFSADCIASFEVIEHLFAPRLFVERCGKLLTEGGLLILTCPNVKGFDVAVLQSLSDTIDPEHLNYFHPESLSSMVANCGFEVLEVMTPGKLDAELVRKKALAGHLDLTGQWFLKQVLLDRWDELGNLFQRFLIDSRLSSHMWLVARKRSASQR